MVGNRPTLAAAGVPQAVARRQKGPAVAHGPFTGRFRYVALNTKVKPFDDINVRKAVVAAIDRNAMRLAFGGRSWARSRRTSSRRASRASRRPAA